MTISHTPEFATAEDATGLSQADDESRETAAENLPPTSAELLFDLRQAYTRFGWAIVYDGAATGTALHARFGSIKCRTALELRLALHAGTEPAVTGMFADERRRAQSS